MKHTLKTTVVCSTDGDELIQEFLHFLQQMTSSRVFKRKLKEYCKISGIGKEKMEKALEGAMLHHSLNTYKNNLESTQVQGSFGSCMLD